ncbi:MAG: DUF4230 domain-containing protein [Sphingorhabdus sp.]
MEKSRLINYSLVALALLLGLVFAVGMAMRSFGSFGPPAPQSVASAALQSVKEQKRLSAFTANYVTAVTSKQQRFGLSARKTLILEGLVRYEIDLDELKADDVRWSPRSNSLLVRLPAIKLTGPQIDMTKIREYDDGGLLRMITNADDVLDAANREKGQAELLLQAQSKLPMKLARDAHRRAIQQLFEVPLRAVDLSARVEAFYGDEQESEAFSSWNEAKPLKKPGAAAH